MNSTDGTVSPIRWTEPAEGLEFGETFLGGVASIKLGRGRSSGYGVYVTDRRIIRIRMRALPRALLVPYLVVIGSLFILTVTTIGSQDILFLFLPLVLFSADQVFRILNTRIAERFISRRSMDVSQIARPKRDFEIRRNQIAELSMKRPGSGLWADPGFLRIALQDNAAQMIKVNIRGMKQLEKLRELISNFAGREPKIPAIEYP